MPRSGSIDVAIVGAGPVGAALAAMLARGGLEARVFEAKAGPSADARTLALSHATRERLADIGAWPGSGTTPIVSIHVSQHGGPGRTLIEAADHDLPALGHTLAYSALEASLHACLARSGLPVDFGASCEDISLAGDRATVRLAGGAAVDARLLVLADGGANASKIPGIAFTLKDYDQVAVVARVAADRAHSGRAWERFTPHGPMALLPIEDRYALVWTAAPAAAQRLLELPDGAFLAQLQERFGDRAGRFVSAGARASFPLRLRMVNTPVALRTAIIGNAAQALHPIAGQGLNLGLRDAAELAEAILASPREVGDHAMLARYRDARRRDAVRGAAFTDFLVSAFGDARRTVGWGRGLALGALDVFPAARRLLAERMIHGAPRA